MYQYLDVFEPLYLLLESNTVSAKKLYELISYRFFIVVNCREVQEKVIGLHNASYGNIIAMYTILNDYRKKKKKPLPFDKFEENDLLAYINGYNPIRKIKVPTEKNKLANKSSAVKKVRNPNAKRTKK